ncbi:monooxygenase [Pigmentiphaga aceris]|uniref:Monooxygenase n=1 Tax=Pigmentiphaga aceris TaxID=1940612 RepID=A0A5C0B5I7_9BURK|nr:FAD-dependent monooxygenase [Pigmentiphaga aceris]QEI08131.1 monooxygenase [Pigmentiphaga aceris]
MDTDITVLGAGPVGSTLALLLARHAPDPSRIVVCRADPKPVGGSAGAGAAGHAAGAVGGTASVTATPSGSSSGSSLGSQPGSQSDKPTSDLRVLALNHGSRVLLEDLGVWPQGGSEIHDIHVSQRGRLGRTRITREEFDVPALGTVVGYESLRRALDAAVDASGVTIQRSPASDAAHIRRQFDTGVDLAQGNLRWTSAVAVQAEGGTFDDTQAARRAVQHLRRGYDQHAVIATVRAQRPRPHVAWERFTREGPLALLPYPSEGQADPARLSLVWCCTPERADTLMAADDEQFANALSDTFGDRLGRLSPIGPRGRFPLGVSLRREVVDGRSVAIGNAAQTLHPVAGQGLNLGLRDAARLAQALTPWLRAPGDAPGPQLAAFARARTADRWLTTGLTDLLPRVFATGFAPLEHACGLALLGLDTIQALRAPLARQLMQGRRA